MKSTTASIVSPSFHNKIVDCPTAPRTIVVTLLALAVGLLGGSIQWQPYGILTGVGLASSACFSCLAWVVYRRIGFAGDDQQLAADTRRDEYCL